MNEQKVWLLKIPTRSIGRLCGRMLRHALGMSLEELILRHALDRPLPQTQHGEASGVMMIPILGRGIFLGAHNLEAALQVAGISDIQITAIPGQVIAPPPEGASYLGYVFGQGMSPDAVESSLRQAHQRLVFEIHANIPVNQARA